MYIINVYYYKIYRVVQEDTFKQTRTYRKLYPISNKAVHLFRK